MKQFVRPAILSIAFSIICIFSVVPDIFSQDSSQCMAVITGKKGNVNLKKAGGNEFVKAEWGTQLFKGDQIRTESGSEVSLTFTDGNVHTLGPAEQ